ncbi:MAG: recombination mediator RecR [bacterium]|nr:recombination mediator RecR [bacterium]
MRYPPSIEQLMTQFRQFPGVGPKTAERFVFHLLRLGAPGMDALCDAIRRLRDAVDRCGVCGTFAEATPCATCADPRRDHTSICVVAEPGDLLAMERTNEYRGVYHVLGGLLAPIEGIGPEQLRIPALVARVSEQSTINDRQSAIREVIFAFDPTIEGETTINYLVPLLAPTGVVLSRLARGLPVGGDLEYADPVTLSDALTGRRKLRLAQSPAQQRAHAPQQHESIF